jgi:type IV pilus assembly protein PilW
MHLSHLRGSRRSVAGLTMIELMIAITVALVLLAALAVMYGSSIKASNQLQRSNRQIENGRYAIQLLRDDLQLAGFMGELNLRNGFAFPPAMPDFCVTHLTTAGGLPADAITAGLSPATNQLGDTVLNGLDYLAAGITIYIQGLHNVDPAALPACLTGAGVRPNTDIIVVRRLLSCSTADPGCAFQAGAPYLQASQCSSELNLLDRFRLRADPDTAAFTLRPLGCVAGATMPIRRFATHIYFIANNNIESPADGIPTLKRRELINTGFTTSALVEGIENLQFEYGVDGTDAGGNPLPLDGAPDIYVDLPANVGQWANTRTVRVHLLSRSSETRPGYDDKNTYRLGSENVAAPRDA